MISARVFIICSCACVFGIEGARTQTKGIETALEKATQEQEFGIEGARTQTKAKETALKKATKEQEAVSESITGEAEAEDTEEGNLRPGGCKRTCLSAELGNPRQLDGDSISQAEKMKRDKCAKTYCEQCDHCKKLKAAETKINVAPPSAEQQRVSEEASHSAGEREVLEDVVPVVPFCTANPEKFEKECKLMHHGEELTCAHYRTSWCDFEAAGFNPNAEGIYRYIDKATGSSWPLCCKAPSQMSDKIVTEENTTIVKEKITRRIENHEAVPVCSDSSTLQKETLIGGSIVCRNQETNEFAETTCCDGEVSKLLADKEAANAYCSEHVPDKWCKPGNDGTFEKKRKSKNFPLDEKFTCVRKYMCCTTTLDFCLGPVPSLGLCAGVSGLSGRSQCVAVPVPE